MHFNDVVRELADEFGLSQMQTRRLLHRFSDHIGDTLRAADRIRVPGLGTFQASWTRGRKLKRVDSGEEVLVEDRFLPKFTPSARLVDDLRDAGTRLLRDPRHRDALATAEALLADVDLPVIELDLNTPLPAVCETCGELLGPSWRNLRQTWRQAVPADVRETRDWLAHAARRRLARAAF